MKTFKLIGYIAVVLCLSALLLASFARDVNTALFCGLAAWLIHSDIRDVESTVRIQSLEVVVADLIRKSKEHGPI